MATGRERGRLEAVVAVLDALGLTRDLAALPEGRRPRRRPPRRRSTRTTSGSRMAWVWRPSATAARGARSCAMLPSPPASPAARISAS
jgi:hypothetical protein